MVVMNALGPMDMSKPEMISAKGTHPSPSGMCSGSGLPMRTPPSSGCSSVAAPRRLPVRLSRPNVSCTSVISASAYTKFSHLRHSSQI